MTSSVTSSPRCAGRQCMKTASGAAFITAWLTWEGDEVGQDLAGMGAVGQGVDDRLVRGRRKLQQVLVAAQPRDDAVDVPIEDSRRVADGLPDAQLDVLLGEGRGVSAQPRDANLAGDPGAMRGVLEEHRDVPAVEGPARPARRLLDLMREVQHLAQLPRVEVRDVQEVT